VAQSEAGIDASLDVASATDGPAEASRDAGIDAPSCAVSSDGGWPVCPALSSGPSIFVVDSTQQLFAFDSAGNPMGSVAVPGPVGPLNGGGLTTAAGAVYVTNGQPANSVSAFALDLTPIALPGGSFSPLDAPRGIAFDCYDQQFFVSNGGGGSWHDYGLDGGYVNEADGAFQPTYGVSGVAYDPDDRAYWLANYTGFSTTKWGVEEFDTYGNTLQGNAPTTRFVAPGAHEEPYALAVCTKAATGCETLVVVGFLGDTTNLGTPAVQVYTTDGMPSGAPLEQPSTGPISVSCDSRGRIFVGDQTGLHVFDRSGAALDAGSGGFPGITPPIYGVVAAD
jgi:hypothetical protein